MRKILMFLGGLLLCGLAARGDVLYDNSTGRSNPERFADSDYEFGEEIILAGNGSYTITNFQFEYYGYGPNFGLGQVLVTLRFYLNDGPLGQPGTMVYDSGFYPIPATGSAGSVIQYGGLSITVPKTFTWAVDFVGLGGGGAGLQSAGLSLYAFPTVGLTYDDYWEHSGTNGGWALRVPNAGQPPINFGAKVMGTYTGMPAVIAQPVGGEICPGAPLVLDVTAIGSAPLGYQWYLGGNPISGATSSNFTVASMTGSYVGTYTVAVSNGAGTTNSAAAVVTMTAPPAITANPVGGDVCTGDTLLLGATVTGSTPFSYQWYKSGSPVVVGGTLSNLTLSGITAADVGSYTVQVNNCGGSVTSLAAVVTIKTVPSITSNPTGGNVCLGGSLGLTVVASGSAPLSYQWLKDSTPVPGAILPTLTLSGVTAAEAGNYAVRVSNCSGVVTSAVATVLVAPVFTSNPVGADACPGDTLVLSGAAIGSTPMSYQWLKGGNPVSGATLPTLTLSGVSGSDAGTYVLQASNCGGTTLSTPAVVTVKAIVPMTGVVVYDNTSTRAQPERFSEADFEFGDEIILAGNGTWTLTQFSFEYFGYGPDFNNGNVRIKLRLYLNDGISGAPGTKIYDSGLFNVPATSLAGSVVSLSGLSVSVPRSFTWSVEFIGLGPGSGAGTQAGGLDLYGPPTIGNNYDDYWERSGPGLTWVLRGPQPGQPPVSFGARAVATVTGSPYVIQQPADVVACRGDTVTITPQLVASTTLSYQWFFGLSPLAGQTNLTLVIPFLDTASVGNYSLRAISCLGTVYTRPASVTMRDPGQTAPCLHIVRGVTPGTTVVSWTAFFGSGWRLQETTSFNLSGPPQTWVNTVGTPTLYNGEYSPTVPSSGSTRFFRLVNP